MYTWKIGLFSSFPDWEKQPKNEVKMGQKPTFIPVFSLFGPFWKIFFSFCPRKAHWSLLNWSEWAKSNDFRFPHFSSIFHHSNDSLEFTGLSELSMATEIKLDTWNTLITFKLTLWGEIWSFWKVYLKLWKM